MATPTLSQLVTTPTEAEAEADHLAKLAAGGMPTTSWGARSIGTAFVKVVAKAVADARAKIAALAKGALLGYATGDWLTLRAREAYEIDRAAATFAKGTERLTDAGNAGPFTIPPNGLVVKKANGTSYRSTNAANAVLPKSSTLDIEVQAELAGAGGNASAGELTTLATPTMAGVTVTNPGAITGGADAELDGALVARCRARWATLSFQGGPADAYVHWAQTASAKVTRVQVLENSPAAGSVRVFVAQTGGGFGADPDGVVLTVDGYVQKRRPLCSTVLVASATDVVVNVTAEVRLAAGYTLGGVTPAIQAAVTAYLNGLAIGATVRRAELVGAIVTVAGVVDCGIASLLPAGDVVLAVGEVAKVGSVTITQVS